MIDPWLAERIADDVWRDIELSRIKCVKEDLIEVRDCLESYDVVYGINRLNDIILRLP